VESDNKHLVTQLAEWTRFGFLTRTGPVSVRKRVEGIRYWACDAVNATPHPLRLDGGWVAGR
jgi:hypothetical protein